MPHTRVDTTRLWLPNDQLPAARRYNSFRSAFEILETIGQPPEDTIDRHYERPKSMRAEVEALKAQVEDLKQTVASLKQAPSSKGTTSTACEIM